MSFRKRIIKGASWMFLLRAVSQLLVVGKLVVIARILTPVDFGIFAILTTTLTIFETLSETGLSYAVIHMQVELKKIAKTLFAINVLRGVVLMAAIMFLAPLISFFYNNQSLTNLIIITSIIPLIKSFINPHVITFQKDLNFHKEFLIRFIPTAVNTIVCIVLVLYIPNVFVLIIGLLAGTLAEIIASYIIANRDFSEPFSKDHFKKLFSYSKWITAGSIFTYLSTQLDTILIGRYLGTGMLGLYDVAFKTANIAFTEIINAVSQVMFPLYSKVQNDKKRLLNLFYKHIGVTTLIGLLSSIVFLLFPSQILQILFGDQWVGAANVLRILALYGLLRTAIGPIGPLLLSVGKPKALSKLNVINFTVLLVIIFPLLSLYGLSGVAIAMTVSYALITPLYIKEAIKCFKE